MIDKNIVALILLAWGDDPLFQQAGARIRADDKLAPHYDVLLFEWPLCNGYLEWLVTGHRVEIINWAVQ